MSLSAKRKISAHESAREFEGITQFRYEYALKFIRNKSVLDLGCGFAEGPSLLALNGARHVDGVDYSKNAIDMAKTSFKVPNLDYYWLNVMDLQTLRKQYDVITAFEIIEHLPIPYQAKFLKTIVQLLNPHGILLLTTPNRLIYSQGHPKPHNPFHTREFSPVELSQLIRPACKSFTIQGIRCTNQGFISTSKRVKSTKRYRCISWIETIPLTHEILPFIPQSLKNFVTGRHHLPNLHASDFQLVDSHLDKCESLLLTVRLN